MAAEKYTPPSSGCNVADIEDLDEQTVRNRSVRYSRLKSRSASRAAYGGFGTCAASRETPNSVVGGTSALSDAAAGERGRLELAQGETQASTSLQSTTDKTRPASSVKLNQTRR